MASSFSRRNVLQLNVFYQSVITEVTKEKPAYDIHDFGCKDQKILLLLLSSLLLIKKIYHCHLEV